VVPPNTHHWLEERSISSISLELWVVDREAVPNEGKNNLYDGSVGSVLAFFFT